jgi:hypothetical protein
MKNLKLHIAALVPAMLATPAVLAVDAISAEIAGIILTRTGR